MTGLWLLGLAQAFGSAGDFLHDVILAGQRPPDILILPKCRSDSGIYELIQPFLEAIYFQPVPPPEEMIFKSLFPAE